MVRAEKQQELKQGLFAEASAHENNPKWQKYITRENPIYKKPDDIRSEFARDYNRILHSTAYRRLKHKTQVFYATNNDHVCTRIEHVNHVAAISQTIAKYLGLNVELVNAIAIGHDLGHPPFGHVGEKILDKIINEQGLELKFWHEGNSLRFVDKVETLPDSSGNEQNLNLTYAVRDGIVCHCGEVDQNVLYPREEFIDLETIQKASEFQPYTWEGCIVKISDKIAYLGRDIEDALTYKILTISQKKELKKIAESCLGKFKIAEINNTVLIHDFIIDLCRLSNPQDGIRLSKEYLELMKAVKQFNYKNIYYHPRLKHYTKYAELVITSIFEILAGYYRGQDTLTRINKDREFYPVLTQHIEEWLIKYSDISPKTGKYKHYKNQTLYKIEDQKDYQQAVIDFISGMTDHFAIKVFNEITSF
jgi:dGTPase